MNDEITGWIHKAEADYQAARILLRQRKTLLPDNIRLTSGTPAFRPARRTRARPSVR